MMNDFVTLDYGSGGKKTSQLISELLPLFNNNEKENAELCDGAVLEQPSQGKLVFSTDSFVVSPYFFPGGDIGKLCVCGTVNDLAMMGAKPRYLSLSFILEEGMPFEDLKTICRSIGKAAKDAGVRIVTGDTKVVDKGRGDGIYINTAGIGFLEPVRDKETAESYELKPENIQAGDAVIISGNIGDHGTAVMLARNTALGIHSEIQSDCAALHQEANALFQTLGSCLRVMRDPTRGGLATTLNEFVEDRKDIGIELQEKDIPIAAKVQTACDMLGLDPLYCACEGRLIAVVSPEREEEAVELLRSMPHGSGAKIIGRVVGKEVSGAAGRLIIRTPLGTGRIAAKLSGAQLPRIC